MPKKKTARFVIHRRERMTGDELREIAVTMFGKKKAVDSLTQHLRVNKVSVYRWLNGSLPVPGPVEACIRCWRARHRELKITEPLDTLGTSA